MPRSVVRNGAPRCGRCLLPPRWCVCAGLRPIALPLAVDILMHPEEAHRPSSTGHLIDRVVPGTRVHRIGRAGLPARAGIVRPGRELWVLHPLGDPPPADADPAKVQVLLLDGSWRQALEMMRVTGQWGRRVALPMAGTSRYWLRAQQGETQFSTAEALIFLLETLRLDDATAALRQQFELHVYASLCARGKKAAAQEFLQDSPIRNAFPGLLAQLAEKRPRERRI